MASVVQELLSLGSDVDYIRCVKILLLSPKERRQENILTCRYHTQNMLRPRWPMLISYFIQKPLKDLYNLWVTDDLPRSSDVPKHFCTDYSGQSQINSSTLMRERPALLRHPSLLHLHLMRIQRSGRQLTKTQPAASTLL